MCLTIAAWQVVSIQNLFRQAFPSHLVLWPSLSLTSVAQMQHFKHFLTLGGLPASTDALSSRVVFASIRAASIRVWCPLVPGSASSLLSADSAASTFLREALCALVTSSALLRFILNFLAILSSFCMKVRSCKGCALIIAALWF